MTAAGLDSSRSGPPKRSKIFFFISGDCKGWYQTNLRRAGPTSVRHHKQVPNSYLRIVLRNNPNSSLSCCTESMKTPSTFHWACPVVLYGVLWVGWVGGSFVGRGLLLVHLWRSKACGFWFEDFHFWNLGEFQCQHSVRFFLVAFHLLKYCAVTWMSSLLEIFQFVSFIFRWVLDVITGGCRLDDFNFVFFQMSLVKINITGSTVAHRCQCWCCHKRQRPPEAKKFCKLCCPWLLFHCSRKGFCFLKLCGQKLKSWCRFSYHSGSCMYPLEYCFSALCQHVEHSTCMVLVTRFLDMTFFSLSAYAPLALLKQCCEPNELCQIYHLCDYEKPFLAVCERKPFWLCKKPLWLCM